MSNHLQLNCFVLLFGVLLMTNAQYYRDVYFFANKQRCNCQKDKDCSRSKNGAGTCSRDECVLPYIGATCQHANVDLVPVKIAFTPRHIFKYLIDGVDTTCNKQSWSGMGVLETKYSIHFIWIYIVRNNTSPMHPRLALYNDGLNLKIEFYVLKLNKNSLLIKSCENVFYNKLEVSNLPTDTCTVEVSIGRNLAISSDPWMRSDNKSPPSTPRELYKASDGHDKKSYTLSPKKGGGGEWWGTRLKHDAKVNLILILMNLRKEHCWKCLVHVFASNGTLVFNQLTRMSGPRTMVYVGVDATVREVELTFQKKKKNSRACPSEDVMIDEMYIYGEFRCPSNLCGVLCDKPCPEGCTREMCDPDWGCSERCSQKWVHDRCPRKCRFRYGLSCEYLCSDDCAGIGDCETLNGHCRTGCKDGYYPPNCTTACQPGYFGMNCSTSCLTCARNKTTNVHDCDPSSGKCLHGCDVGFHGDKCEDIVVLDDILTKEEIYYLFVFICAFIILSYRGCIRGEDESMEEAEEEVEEEELQEGAPALVHAFTYPEVHDVKPEPNAEIHQLPVEAIQKTGIGVQPASPDSELKEEVRQLPVESIPENVTGAKLAESEPQEEVQELPTKSFWENVFGTQPASSESKPEEEVKELKSNELMVENAEKTPVSPSEQGQSISSVETKEDSTAASSTEVLVINTTLR